MAEPPWKFDISAAERQQLLQEALRRQVRLLKAVRFYPPRHPALVAAAEQALHGFGPLLPSVQPLLITVRKEGFLLEEQPLASENPLLKKLSLHLFARRVQSLLLLPDLSVRDLLAFARCLVLDPAIIQAQGGMAEILGKARVITLWVNETDLTRIRRRREEIEAENRLAGREDSFEEDLEQLLEIARQQKTGEKERDLETVLEELRGEIADAHYRRLLQEMVPLVRAALADLDRYLVLAALDLLFRDSTKNDRSALRRGLAGQTLEQLFSEEMAKNLIDLLCGRGLSDAIRLQIFQLLAFFPEQTVPLLMERLAREKDLQARRLLIEALIYQGNAAAPILTGFLDDARWFVVRNAVAVLGEIRDANSASPLLPLLNHRDVRVARETLRAVTKIGGPRVVKILLSLVEGEDPSLGRQALLSLGALKSLEAVPTLVRLIGRPDPLGKRAGLKKEAIKALGEIGAPEAAPALTALLKRRRLWRSGQLNELRAAAAAALGELGLAASQKALEAATEDQAENVARAAAYALKQLKKAENNGSGAS